MVNAAGVSTRSKLELGGIVVSLSPSRKRQVADFLAANLCIVSVLVVSFAGMVLLSLFTGDVIALSTIPLLVGSLAVTGAAAALRPDVSWAVIGLGRRSIGGLFWGTALGAAAVTALVLAVVLQGWAAWTPSDASAVRFDWTEARLAGVALLAVGAAGEEIALRGLALQFLARGVGPAAAIALTSAGFALLHGQNPSVTELAQLNTALFGAVFGIAALRCRSLWLVIGLHFGWNAAQVALGVNNSGITIRLTELNLELGNSTWLTGGEYGLEGGVLATTAAVALGAGFALLPCRQGRAGLLWQVGRPTAAGCSGTDSPGALALDARDARAGGARGEDREADDRAAR